MRKVLIFNLLLILLFPFSVFAETCDTNNVIIKSIEKKNNSEGTDEKTEATIDNNKINLDITMSSVDDYIEYEFNVENKTEEALIFNEKSLVSEDNHFNYEFTYEDNSNIIPSHDDKDITLTITYTRQIDDSEFENGSYKIEETNKLGIMDSKILNPKTANYFIIFLTIILGVIAVGGVVFIKNKYMKTLLILCYCLIPVSVYALCSYEVELNTNIEVSSSKMMVGDYFTLVPDLSSFTISTSATGHTSNQTIIPNELTLWRVISNNNDGTIDAISEYTSSSKVYFSGTNGYANYIGSLQELASSYLKAGYTEKARMLGYNGQTLHIEDRSYFDGSKDVVPPKDVTYTSPDDTGVEYLYGTSGDTLNQKDIKIVGDVYKNDEYPNGLISYSVTDPSTPAQYWIAGRFNLKTSNLVFAVQYVNVDSESGYGLRVLSGWGWNDSGSGFGLRPIITLKKQVRILDGEGLKDNPYTLTNE